MFSNFQELWHKPDDTFIIHFSWKCYDIFLHMEQKIMMKCKIPVVQ